jgi:putative DNA primase/helicase
LLTIRLPSNRMASEKDPGALAGALEADRNVAGRQPDLFTISPERTRAAAQKPDGVAPNGAPAKPEYGAADAAEIAKLAALPLAEYERERKPAAKRLGYRLASLDRAVEAARSGPSHPGDEDSGAAMAVANGETGRAGRALGVDEIDPWPVPVDGAMLVAELAQTIRRYVVLDAATADAVALWIVHTHAIDAAEISPRLAISSPDKRCGKRRCSTCLAPLSPGPWRPPT